MAKKRPLGDNENGGKAWREGDLITTFGLKRIKEVCTNREDLLKIIAILRKFRTILRERLLD